MLARNVHLIATQYPYAIIWGTLSEFVDPDLCLIVAFLTVDVVYDKGCISISEVHAIKNHERLFTRQITQIKMHSFLHGLQLYSDRLIMYCFCWLHYVLKPFLKIRINHTCFTTALTTNDDNFVFL